MRAFKIVLAVSALIATAATVSAVDLKAARKGITAEEAKFCKALMHKDMSWFEAMQWLLSWLCLDRRWLNPLRQEHLLQALRWQSVRSQQASL